MAEWNVYYDSFFLRRSAKAEDAKLRCRSFHQQNFFFGGAEEWKVLSMYLFDKGQFFTFARESKMRRFVSFMRNGVI